MSSSRRQITCLTYVEYLYVLPEGYILAGYYDFDANISFTFQAVKNLFAHPTNLCSGLFCKFFGDFWVYLDIESFPQRISKIY